MSNEEIKQRLIDRIKDVDNPELLKEVYRILEMEEKQALELKEPQIAFIKKAQKQAEEGKVVTNEDFFEKIDQWLNE